MRRKLFLSNIALIALSIMACKKSNDNEKLLPANMEATATILDVGQFYGSLQQFVLQATDASGNMHEIWIRQSGSAEANATFIFDNTDIVNTQSLYVPNKYGIRESLAFKVTTLPNRAILTFNDRATQDETKGLVTLTAVFNDSTLYGMNTDTEQQANELIADRAKAITYANRFAKLTNDLEPGTAGQQPMYFNAFVKTY